MTQKYIFLHQVKTGGKTIEKFLLRKFGNQYCKTTNVFVDESLGNVFEILDASKKEKFAQLAQVDVISGHYPFGIHEFYAPEARYFTLLRHPVLRLRSYYNYSLANHGSAVQQFLEREKLPFEEFAMLDGRAIEQIGIHELHYVLENGQTKILAGVDQRVGQEPMQDIYALALKNIEAKFDFVGITELFDYSFHRIVRLLGFSPLNTYITQNRSAGRKLVDPKLYEKVMQRNELDCKLYDAHFDKLTRESASLSSRLGVKYIEGSSWLADRYVAARLKFK